MKLFSLTGLTLDELQMITTGVEDLPMNSRASVARVLLLGKIQEQYNAALVDPGLPMGEPSVNLPVIDSIEPE